MNKIFDPDPSEFEKLEKERIIKELEKVIQKTEREGREEDVEKLKKELKALTHESFWDILFKPIY